jgi:hypothetical protein
VIDYFWDRLLGTYRSAEADDGAEGWVDRPVAMATSKKFVETEA